MSEKLQASYKKVNIIEYYIYIMKIELPILNLKIISNILLNLIILISTE